MFQILRQLLRFVALTYVGKIIQLEVMFFRLKKRKFANERSWVEVIILVFQVFMSCNLIGGMFQRLDKMRKAAFASACLFGSDDDSTISGIWVWRGQDLAFQVSFNCRWITMRLVFER